MKGNREKDKGGIERKNEWKDSLSRVGRNKKGRKEGGKDGIKR